MKLKGVENVILKSRMKEYELIEKLVEHLVERNIYEMVKWKRCYFQHSFQ